MINKGLSMLSRRKSQPLPTTVKHNQTVLKREQEKIELEILSFSIITYIADY